MIMLTLLSRKVYSFNNNLSPDKFERIPSIDSNDCANVQAGKKIFEK